VSISHSHHDRRQICRNYTNPQRYPPRSHICRQELHRLAYQFRRNELNVVGKGSKDEVGFWQGQAQSTFAAFSGPSNFTWQGKILNSWFKTFLK